MDERRCHVEEATGIEASETFNKCTFMRYDIRLEPNDKKFNHIPLDQAVKKAQDAYQGARKMKEAYLDAWERGESHRFIGKRIIEPEDAYTDSLRTSGYDEVYYPK